MAATRTAMQVLSPLHLEPILVPKPWGGQSMTHFGRELPPDLEIGESWDVADLDPTITSLPRSSSLVLGGPHAGHTLGEVLLADPGALLGSRGDLVEGFPVLQKLIDAREQLSVQVHPPHSYSDAGGAIRTKSETWIVLDAAPGAELLLGLREGVALADVRARAGSPEFVDLLRRVPAHPGAVHHVPAGLVHALGAGVMVIEVQTPSDTTFRLYDWTHESGRQSRELHLEEGLASIELAWDLNVQATSAGATDVDEGGRLTSEHYRMRWLEPRSRRWDLQPQDAVRILTVLAGQVVGDDLQWPLETGGVVVVPASWSGRLHLSPGTRLLEVSPSWASS